MNQRGPWASSRSEPRASTSAHSCRSCSSIPSRSTPARAMWRRMSGSFAYTASFASERRVLVISAATSIARSAIPV